MRRGLYIVRRRGNCSEEGIVYSEKGGIVVRRRGGL